jgi:ectoine hydroxylase-related dioxygenase (phytanoyl-CoA dioxygenase family)
MVFNTNWCLTDYTKDNGALAVVPESHKLRRHPRPGEAAKQAIPVEAPAGSVIVFHGNLWHGSFPRMNPGMRLTITAYYSAHYCRPQEHFPSRISEESLARNGERFRQLLNVDDLMGIEDRFDCGVPRRERGSGKTYHQLLEKTVTYHGQEYRIERDNSIVNHAAGSAVYIPVDADEKEEG